MKVRSAVLVAQGVVQECGTQFFVPHPDLPSVGNLHEHEVVGGVEHLKYESLAFEQNGCR